MRALNRKFKVAVYTPFFFPVVGGTENATRNIAKELRKSCDVEIYTFDWTITSDEDRNYGLSVTHGLPRREKIDGVWVHRYPIVNLPIVKNFSVELIKDLGFSDIEIVHFQGLHRLPSRWLLQQAVRKKIKVLTTHALQESIDIIRRSKYRFLIKRFFVDSLRNMDHIVALSPSDSQSLINLGVLRDKISVIPNGIDPKKFSKRRHFVEKNNKLKILCVARFDRNKKYESLISVLSRLASQGLDVEAYFVGAVSDKEYFKKILELVKANGLEKTIRFGTSIDDPALIDCYLSCDVFVLPSSMETFPLAIIEAMYAGLPIIASKVGGIPDIVRNGVNGFLVDPNDINELYEKCLQLLKDDMFRDSMREANLKAARSYTWDKIAASTYNLYELLMEKRDTASF